MKTTPLYTGLALLGLMTAAAPRQNKQEGVRWHSNLATATKLARDSNRPLLIVFR